MIMEELGEKWNSAKEFMWVMNRRDPSIEQEEKLSSLLGLFLVMGDIALKPPSSGPKATTADREGVDDEGFCQIL